MSGWLGADDILFEELTAALVPVPSHALAAGRACFSWRTIDAELADLCYDSAHDPVALGETRAETATLRYLTFQSGDQSIELEAVLDVMHGQLVPPRQGRVEVHRPDGSVDRSEINESGYFCVQLAHGSRFRLLCAPSGSASIITDWITL